MKIKGVIPARNKSSRFPGKSLADILGFLEVSFIKGGAAA